MKTKNCIDIIMSDKVDIKTKTVIKDKAQHYIMLKGATEQETTTCINTYALNIVGVPKY